MSLIGDTPSSVQRRERARTADAADGRAAARVRILHTSDVHLDNTAASGPHETESDSWRALTAIVDLSIQVSASIVIVAGDLFESNRIDAATAEMAARCLRRLAVPVVIVPGNHDCLRDDSIYGRVHLPDVADNIRVFSAASGETFSFPELDLAVWGKPIPDYGGDLRPLSGPPPRGRERWHIGVAHGYYVGRQTNRAWSFQISEDEIVASCFDYVALGHWAAFRCVHDGAVKAYYSGSPSAGTRTVAIVDLQETGVDVARYLLDS